MLPPSNCSNWFSLATLVSIAALCQAVEPVGTLTPPQLSRFDKLTQTLHTAPKEDQTAFAQSAVTELIEVYSAESGLARRPDEQSPSARDGQWARAVDAYTERLIIALEAVNVGHEVTIIPLLSDVALLLPGMDFSVLLEHPRVSQQFAFEQAVMASFCRQGRCDRLLKAPASRGREAEPIAVTAGDTEIEWSFTSDDVVCAASGVSVRFITGAITTQRMRGLCEQLHYELSAIMLEIRWQLSRGVLVEPEHLALIPRSDQTGHVLQLNEAGDAALVRMPLLTSTPGLLRVLSPWLRDRARGDETKLVIEAASWGWTLGD